MNENFMYIQHDWDECIRSAENRVWISVKPRNGPSIHGHLQCKSYKLNGIPIIQGTNGFEVESVSSHAIQVKHSSCPSVTLLSPYRIFNDVHNSSVTSLDVIGGQCVSASDSVLKSWSSLDHEKEKEVTMTGHYGDIYCCRWFPSVKVVLSCGADLRIKIWSADTGECAGTLVGHTKAVTDLAIIDRGRNIISVSKDGTSKLWHVGSGKVIDDLIKLNQTTYINCCSISSPKNLNLGERDIPTSDTEIGTDDKCLLIGCENGMLSLIGVYARKILATNNLDSPVNACHLNDDAQIYVGCNDGRVIWLDEQLVTKHCIFDTNSPVRSLCLFKELVVCGHGDGSCVLRSVNGKKAYLTGTNAEPIFDVRTDTRFLYTACRDGIIRKYLPELL
ncbi:proteasomal ATPase-associated factor 1-like [Aphis craccivora]|uniref:Proteasomal ATPase-associated factor 1-like n=1 Tax=Aphis craccivora TaxID=307492 RepID=A0A6G0YGT5_APHCR|nr:proteasomal ATPase-associated factor 1-like [Aphis craccivora]